MIAVAPTRERFHRQLVGLEADTLHGLALVRGQLERAMRSVAERDPETAALVIADDALVAEHTAAVHDRIVGVAARESPVDGDLRLVVALLQVCDDIERMGGHCVDIAKLVALDATDIRIDACVLHDLDEMGGLAIAAIDQSRRAFAGRDLTAVWELGGRDEALDELNRDVFREAWGCGEDAARRAWAMRMLLAARALQRIGHGAVDIGRQATYLVTGRTPPRRHGARRWEVAR